MAFLAQHVAREARLQARLDGCGGQCHSADRSAADPRKRTLILTQMPTIGTLIYTWLCGERVGTDAFGNRYFRSRKASHKRNGRERRWVFYKGIDEASKVPPEWHAWLHHMSEAPLTGVANKARPWQKPHLPNLTGTRFAYRPKGHDLRGGRRPHATGDYEPWIPD